MSPYIGLFFDILIAVAFVATIIHARRLSRQFNQMQADRKAFDQLIQAMNLASSRAEAAIRVLKDTSTDTGDGLQDRINQGRALADELGIMIQAGDNLAERLNAAAEGSRRNAAMNDGRDSPVETSKGGMQPRTKAEKELLDALKTKQKT